MCKPGTEVEMYVLEADIVWRKRKIDPCIAPLIAMLNGFGIATESSCCGHGKGESEIILSANNFSLRGYASGEFSVILRFPPENGRAHVRDLKNPE